MRNKTIKTGFTLVELLVSISVLSILLLISVGVYKSSTDRAKITSTKANMRLFQATVEMYAVDSNGLYPVSVDALKAEAKVEGYWKDFRNPVTNNIDPVTDLALSTTVPAGGIGYRSGSTDPFLVGNSLTFVRRFAALAPITATTTGTVITSYSIVGSDPSGAIISSGDGAIFVLTNGDYKPSNTPNTQPSIVPTTNNYNPDDYTKPEEIEKKEKEANENKKYNDEQDKLKEDLNKKTDEIAKRRNEADKNQQKKREQEDKLKAERRKEEDKKRIEKWKEEDKKRNERRTDNDKKLKPADLKASNEKRNKADEKRAEKRDELEKIIQNKRDETDRKMEEKRKSIDNQIELLRKEYDRKIQQKNAVSNLKNTEDNKSSENNNSNNNKKN